MEPNKNNEKEYEQNLKIFFHEFKESGWLWKMIIFKNKPDKMFAYQKWDLLTSVSIEVHALEFKVKEAATKRDYVKEKSFGRFDIKPNNLSEDIEEFILEMNDYYEHEYPSKEPLNKNERFFKSFYKTCTSMWTQGLDLSDKQLAIIYREYNKVKDKRMNQITDMEIKEFKESE